MINMDDGRELKQETVSTNNKGFKFMIYKPNQTNPKQNKTNVLEWESK